MGTQTPSQGNDPVRSVHAFDQELAELDAVDTARAVASGALSPLEVTDAAIRRAAAVEPELHAIVVAKLPVARRMHSMDEAAIVQHRQVEPAPIPADELRRVAIDRRVEGLDQLSLVVVGLPDRTDTKPGVIAEHAGDRDDTMQMQRQEVAAGLLPPLIEEPLCNIGIAQLG